MSIAGTLDGCHEFRAHNRPRDRDRIGERLGADERRPDVEDTGGVLAVDALARAVRFERAFIKQDRAAGAVRQDERDRVSGAPSYRLAGQELAMRVEQDGGRLRLIDIDPDVNAILARPVFDVESAAAHAQCGVRADLEDRTRLRSTAIGRSRTLSDFMAAHASLEIALALDGDREPRAYPSAAQRPGEGRAGAGPRGRSGIRAPRVGRRGFARGYALGDRPGVDRIANAAPPHGAESCRGSRPASNAALFDILRLRGNLHCACATISRYTRASVEP